jgi:TRAP-type mannitol/chloroaromatic compound transport system substrate-binding protein
MTRISSLIAAAGVAVLGLGAAPASAEGADYNWRLAVGYSRGVALADLHLPFAENIGEMSGGRIAVQIVYNGEGVNQEEIFGAVKSGLVQMGLPYMALFYGEFPPGLIQLGLPGGPRTISS